MFYQVLFISIKKSTTLNGVFLTLKLVKIPSKKLALTSTIINISEKKYEPIWLERMALKTLIKMKREKTLKLFEEWTHEKLYFTFHTSCCHSFTSTRIPANAICSVDISCPALNFLTLYIYNALIKISSDSQYTVSLTCTETNDQLMLKHCSKRDKLTKINYQQPRYLLYYCHLSENNEKKPIYYGAKREALLCEQNSAKSFVMRVIRTAFINMTAPSCFTKK